MSLEVVGVVGRLALSGGASQAQLQSSSPSCHETLMKTWSGANIVPLADTLEIRWIIRRSHRHMEMNMPHEEVIIEDVEAVD